jgi:Helix-turn-helix domain
MKDTFCRRFFLEPQQTLHRRYEALRAVFVDQQPQREVAQRFGYTYATLRRLVSDFRAQCRAGQVPPFSLPRSMGDLPGHASAMDQLARTRRSGRMCVGCR